MRDVLCGGVVAATIFILAGTASAECAKLPKPLQMPQGATATSEEMQEGRVALQNYVNILQTFQKCREDEIKAAPADTKPEVKQKWQAEADSAIDAAHTIADVYSIQLRAYKARGE